MASLVFHGSEVSTSGRPHYTATNSCGHLGSISAVPRQLWPLDSKSAGLSARRTVAERSSLNIARHWAVNASTYSSTVPSSTALGHQVYPLRLLPCRPLQSTESIEIRTRRTVTRRINQPNH